MAICKPRGLHQATERLPKHRRSRVYLPWTSRPRMHAVCGRVGGREWLGTARGVKHVLSVREAGKEGQRGREEKELQKGGADCCEL